MRFISKYVQDNDICVYVRALMEASFSAAKEPLAFQLLLIEEGIRKEKKTLNNHEALVMYYCQIKRSPLLSDRL